MILLGLGSNLGDRKSNLDAALKALGQGNDAPLQIQHVSSIYESAALLPENAPPEWDISYYNIVISAITTLKPEKLLQTIKRIEVELGRKDIGRWGPRIIDIDILAYDDMIHVSESLIIPHAEMLGRDFVMIPLAELHPHWHYPTAAKITTQTPLTAQQVVEQKAMTLGEGLKRLPLTLQWQQDNA